MDRIEMDDLYYVMFLEETKEQIENIEHDLLLLENGGDAEIIHSIFRMAHSIKGAAATMGFDEMSKIAHHLESLLDQVREKKIGINSKVMNTFFKSIDVLKNMHYNLGHGGKWDGDSESIIQEIQWVMQDRSNIPKRETEPVHLKPREEVLEQVQLELDEEEKLLCQEVNPKLDIYKMMIEMSKNTVMKSVKAFLVMNNLLGIGDVIKTKPEDFEQMSDEGFGNTFEIVIATNRDYESLYKNINSISEIKHIYMNKVREGDRTKLHLPENVRIVEGGKREEKTTVRVDVAKIDKLLNLVGEFIIDKENLVQIGQELKKKYKDDPMINKLVNLLPHTSFIGSELQETVMSMRMLPLENIFNRFPRMVRDLAKTCEKEIHFILEGKDTEIDRSMIEALVDPLTHILRNAIDHGIERAEERKSLGKNPVGTLKLSAHHEEGCVVIQVEDDGKGLNVKKIKEKAIEKGLVTQEGIKQMSEEDILQFIFEAGFSTTQSVSDISGRGVGLDVVKSNIGRLHGIVDLKTELGKGTRFTIKLPLTLAIIQALLIKEKEHIFAIPISSIIEIIRLKGDEMREKIHRHGEMEIFDWRGQALPVIRIGEYFHIEENRPQNKMILVVVGHSEKKMVFMIEKLLREQEIVVKSMGDFIGKDKLFGSIDGILGVSILGDGSFAQILDVASVGRRRVEKNV